MLRKIWMFDNISNTVMTTYQLNSQLSRRHLCRVWHPLIKQESYRVRSFGIWSWWGSVIQDHSDHMVHQWSNESFSRVDLSVPFKLMCCDPSNLGSLIWSDLIWSGSSQGNATRDLKPHVSWVLVGGWGKAIWGQTLLDMRCWPLRIPTPLLSIVWPVIHHILLVTVRQM